MSVFNSEKKLWREIWVIGRMLRIVLPWHTSLLMQSCMFLHDPLKKYLRQWSREFGIEKSSVHRILRAQDWKPYIPKLVRALNEDNPDRRLQFWEWFLHKCHEREDFQDSIVRSDEATFKFNGIINRHNCVYSANENPNNVEENIVNLPGVAVWCGLPSRGLIGPYIFEETVTGQTYLQMLEIMRPRLNDLAENEKRFTSNKTELHLTFMSMWDIISIAHSIRD